MDLPTIDKGGEYNTYVPYLISGKFTNLVKELEVKFSSGLTNFENILQIYAFSRLGYFLKAQELIDDYLTTDHLPEMEGPELTCLAEMLLLESMIDQKKNLPEVRIQKFDGNIVSIKNSDLKLYLEGKSEILWIHYLLSEHQLKKLKKKFKNLKKLLKQYPINEISGQLYFLKGRFSEQEGKYKEAISEYLKSIDYFSQMEDKQDQAYALNAIAIAYASRGHFEKALDYFDELLELNAYLDNNTMKAKVYNNLATIYQIGGDLNKSMMAYKESIKLSEAVDNYVSLEKSYINIGNLQIAEGKYPNAMHTFRRAMYYHKFVNDDYSYSCINSSMGIISQYMGNFKQAESYYNKSLERVRLMNNKEMLVKGLNSLAILHNQRGLLDQAVEEFNEVMQLSEEIDDAFIRSKALTNLGLVYFKMDQYEKSMEYFKQSYNLKLKFGNPQDLSVTLYHMINVSTEHGDDETTEKYLQELAQLSRTYEIKDIQIRYDVARANYLQTSQNEDDQYLASQLIEKVVSSEMINFEMNVFATISLCEYLLLEFKQTSNKIYLEELQNEIV